MPILNEIKTISGYIYTHQSINHKGSKIPSHRDFPPKMLVLGEIKITLYSHPTGPYPCYHIVFLLLFFILKDPLHMLGPIEGLCCVTQILRGSRDSCHAKENRMKGRQRKKDGNFSG